MPIFTDLTIPKVCPGGRLWLTTLTTAVCLAMFYPLVLGFAEPSEQETLVRVTTPAGAVILTELADTTKKRATGLMHRNSLPQDRGMLFTFPEPQLWTFWMKNTNIPLDILWMDGHRKIVHIEHNVPACHLPGNACPQYQPNYKSVYVLELAAGTAEALRLEKGTKLKFQLPQAARP